MNFNDIPNQLRTPLFFCEVSINGNTPPEVASNNDPAPPLISCTGATSIMSFSQSTKYTKMELRTFTKKI